MQRRGVAKVRREKFGAILLRFFCASLLLCASASKWMALPTDFQAEVRRSARASKRFNGIAASIPTSTTAATNSILG